MDIEWIEFILMPFNSTPDQSFIMNKVHLVPVKNIGVVLKDSRHFVISKIHPKDKRLLLQLIKGLKYSALVALLLKHTNKRVSLLIEIKSLSSPLKS